MDIHRFIEKKLVETPEKMIPIEVKWTSAPTRQNAKHLHLFLTEYPQTSKGFIICQTPHPMKISEQVIALPWGRIGDVFN